MAKTKLIDGYPFVAYSKETFSSEEMVKKSNEFYKWMDKRRTVRDFSSKPVPKEVIENIVLAASAAPSGAHKQPWTFCVVSDTGIKKQIRSEAEKEEFESYNGRMPEE
jgi:nitroreductase